MRKRAPLYYWLSLAIIYAVTAFLAPISKSQTLHYHLSNIAIHWIDFSIIVPIIGILYLAYVGFYNLREYYLRIVDTADGQAFQRITYGVGVFAYGSLVTSILSTGLKWIAVDYPSFAANSARIGNYLSLIIPLVAFTIMSQGVQRLVAIGKLKFKDLKMRTVLAVIALVSTSYAFVIFHQDSTPLKAVASGPNLYFMPAWLVLFTIVIPYVYAWSVGFISVFQMLTYRQKTKGLVYKKALNTLANGFGVVLVSYIAIEYLTSLSSKLYGLRVGWLLLIIYLFLLLIGIGYLFIAVGAKRLKRIEEV